MEISNLKYRLLGSKLINDSFWSLLGNIISKGLALVSGIVVARLLGKDIYGEYGIIRNTLLYIGLFSTFGLGYTATKFVAEYKNNKPEYTKLLSRYTSKITLSISVFLMLLLFFTADYFAERVLSAPHLSTPLRFLSVIIVFNALTTTQIGVLAGLGKFKELARINTITGVVTFVSSCILTYYYKLNGALAALLITQILNYVFNYKLINKNIPKNIIDTKSDKILLKEIINFSTPVALQESFYYIFDWVNSILLIKLASYGELGLYSAAMQWNALILFIPSILRNVILANLSEANKDEVKHSRIIKITLIINVSVTFILAVIVFLFSSLINKLYGISFEGLDKLIGFVVLLPIFGSISNVYAQAYMSKGMNWLMFYLRIIRDGGIILIFLLLFKTDFLRPAGSLIFSNLIMYIVFSIIMIVVYNNKIKIRK